MLDFEVINVLGQNRTAEIRKYLWDYSNDGYAIIDLEAEDLTNLISRVKPSSLHYVGLLCEENKKSICDVLYIDNIVFH